MVSFSLRDPKAGHLVRIPQTMFASLPEREVKMLGLVENLGVVEDICFHDQASFQERHEFEVNNLGLISTT